MYPCKETKTKPLPYPSQSLGTTVYNGRKNLHIYIYIDWKFKGFGDIHPGSSLLALSLTANWNWIRRSLRRYFAGWVVHGFGLIQRCLNQHHSVLGGIWGDFFGWCFFLWVGVGSELNLGRWWFLLLVLLFGRYITISKDTYASFFFRNGIAVLLYNCCRWTAFSLRVYLCVFSWKVLCLLAILFFLASGFVFIISLSTRNDWHSGCGVDDSRRRSKHVASSCI